MNHNGFLLKRLKISGHPVLKNIDISFCDGDEDGNGIYITGIIGANGTGKSHLMGAIASVFSEIRKAIDSNNYGRKRYSFIVYYDCMGASYMVTNNNGTYWDGFSGVYGNYIKATRNEIQIDLQELILPDKVIASTMTITDKFLAKSDSFYRYKGIRNEKSASTTGTRTIIRKTVESLMACMSSKSAFQDELRILLSNLGLEEHLHVSYGMRYKHVFLRADMTVTLLREIFDNWQKYFPARLFAPWGYNNYIRGLRDNEVALGAAARFLAEKSKKGIHDYSIVKYDVMADPEAFQRDAEALRVLTQLDLLTFPSINVVKKGMAFGLENSSSGETHLLSQFIGIMSDIKHDSLVLIDEPENSSHPDWQMNYADWLKNIFRTYRDCHFIIATHSPLILANLKASESTIIRLKRDENNKIMDEGGMERGCYSWTIDEILQDVMKMKKENTDEYTQAIKSFEIAVRNNDRKMADSSYELLKQMINPQNELLELLKIQKAMIDYD